MPVSFIFIPLILFVVEFGSLIGAVYVLLTSGNIRREYKAYVSSLKRQSQYSDWVTNNRNLVIFEIMNTFVQVFFLLALLLFVGNLKGYIELPKILLYISGVLVWMFWPYYFISQLFLSRWYKRVLAK